MQELLFKLPTEFLSGLSDRACASLVARSAKQLAAAVMTPVHFLEMLFLIEDKRFAIHFGVDPLAIARALLFNFRGGVLQGGSTIPQQLYNVRLRQSGRVEPSRRLSYKLRQSLWAVCNSATIPKATLLKDYVASVYLGKSYYGLDQAAKGYFETPRSSLSILQSFFLAERVAAPNRIAPARIANLLGRPAVVGTLTRYELGTKDVISFYDSRYGCGGDICRNLEK